MRSRAAVYAKHGSPLVVDEIELAAPGPDQVLVKLFASGICHSQLHQIHDPKHPTPPDREVPPATQVNAPGEPEWSAKSGGTIASSDVAGQIRGYASACSVNLGDSIDFHVSVDEPQTFVVEVWRVGATDVRVLTSPPIDGATQPWSGLDPATHTIRCAWTPSWRLDIPADWRSGVYVAKLRNAAGFQTCVPFVVRDDAAVHDVLVLLPFPTYQAYNEYPKDKQTGASL